MKLRYYHFHCGNYIKPEHLEGHKKTCKGGRYEKVEL
jgi:hypothetical protein